MIETIECVGIVLAAIIVIIVFCTGTVIYVDNYMSHKEMKHIRADKKARDEAFKYWERQEMHNEYRYTCPVCVATRTEPSRYCPDCGTRLKTK